MTLLIFEQCIHQLLVYPYRFSCKTFFQYCKDPIISYYFTGNISFIGDVRRLNINNANKISTRETRRTFGKWTKLLSRGKHPQ